MKDIKNKEKTHKKMKEGLVHVCFVLDESGSMSYNEGDVKGGFKKVIEEQKALTDGGCIVSLYKFNSTVKEVYLGKDVKEIDSDNLDYSPGGMTAMNDGIGTAIDSVGKWLAAKDESERPEKNLIIIMTDGAENASHEYSLEQVREKIKHQTEKYDWSFVYMGTDVTDSSYTNNLMGGIKNCTSLYNSRDNHTENYSLCCSVATTWRGMKGSTYAMKSATLEADLTTAADSLTEKYEKKLGRKIK
jgi:uncharacterized protein YegL